MLTNSNIFLIGSIIVVIYMIYMVALPERRENFVINNLKEYLTIVDPNFEKLDIRESDSSYTEDKSVIFLCLRNEKGEVYPMNTVMYVALHEIAHMINKNDYGHTPAFHKIFNDLLCKAAAKGVYDPSKPHGDTYCGVDIRGITMPVCSSR